MNNITKKPLVAVVMGSQSDWSVMSATVSKLEEFAIPHEVTIVSAHRTPQRMFDYAKRARKRGIKCIIAGAGGAAHLPGMIASLTSLPVLGIPVPSSCLNGQDSLLSIVQMPSGIPVATFAIGVAGASNAAIFACSILGMSDERLRKCLKNFRKKQTQNTPSTVAYKPPLPRA